MLYVKRKFTLQSFVSAYLLVFGLCFVITAFGSRAATVMSESLPLEGRHCIIIDAGHGGVDGGTVSCTGILESSINLEIALRLNDLLNLLGYNTQMIRTTDISVYTEGETIAAKKVSDLKHRVNMINETENALLISIHQNHFTDSRYSGAQVFYSKTEGSEELAKMLQRTLHETVNPGSNRQSKKASGVYLMDHITCPGILIECGFLSNVRDEARLRTAEYQKQLCCVITATLSKYINV